MKKKEYTDINMKKKEYIDIIIQLTEEDDIASKWGASTNKKIGRMFGTAIYDITKALTTLANAAPAGKELELVKTALGIGVSAFVKDVPTQETRQLFINSILNFLREELSDIWRNRKP